MSKITTTSNPADAGAAALSAAASNPGGVPSASTTATDGAGGVIAAGDAVPAGAPAGGLPTPFSSPGNPANPSAAGGAPSFAAEGQGGDSARVCALEAELARLKGQQPATATGEGIRSYKWYAYITETAGGPEIKGRRIETAASNNFTAEEAREHTFWSQYDAAGKPRPHSIRIEMIDKNERRPPQYQMPRVVPSPTDPTRGVLVGAKPVG